MSKWLESFRITYLGSHEAKKEIRFKGVGHHVQYHHQVLKSTSFQHLIIQVIDVNSVVPPGEVAHQNDGAAMHHEEHQRKHRSQIDKIVHNLVLN